MSGSCFSCLFSMDCSVRKEILAGKDTWGDSSPVRSLARPSPMRPGITVNWPMASFSPPCGSASSWESSCVPHNYKPDIHPQCGKTCGELQRCNSLPLHGEAKRRHDCLLYTSPSPRDGLL